MKHSKSWEIFPEKRKLFCIVIIFLVCIRNRTEVINRKCQRRLKALHTSARMVAKYKGAIILQDI